MADKSQELAFALLREAKEKGTLDPSIEKGLAELIGSEGRPQVKEALKAPVGVKADAKGVNAAPDKFAQLKQTLATQYGEWDKKVYGNKPALEQVLNSFRDQKLEVAGTYTTPYLLMLPVTEEDSDKITGFQPVIAEGKQEMVTPYTGDYLSANLKDRISVRKQARKNGESGMTRVIYNSLFHEAKKAGEPIDREFWTMLDDDYSEGDPFVPIAWSDHGRPNFVESNAGYPDDNFRFRSAVVGDVLNI